MTTITTGCGCRPSSCSCATSCCEGNDPTVPAAIDNPPAQPSLHHRVGTHASFFESMLAWLVTPPEQAVRCNPTGEEEPDPLLDAETNQLTWPLRDLTSRERDDATIALLDAWAVVGDVLTFYQERIANEGYLRTATEQRSVEELARLVGYRPRPGVAASIDLAFTLERDVVTTIPAGTRAQSLPAPGKLPQVFETTLPLVANARWNALRPLQSRFLRPRGIDDKLVIYLAGTATNLRKNDVVYRPPAPTNDDTPFTLAAEGLFRVDRIEILADISMTRISLRLYTLDDIFDGAQDIPEFEDDEDDEVGKVVGSFSAKPNKARFWTERALLDVVQGDRVLRDSLRRAIEEVAAARTSKTELYVFRASSPLFGHNAPAKRFLGVKESGDINEVDWPLAGESNTVVFLDAVNERVQPDGYIVIDQAATIEAPSGNKPYDIEDALRRLDDQVGSPPENRFGLKTLTAAFLTDLAKSPNRLQRFWFETLDKATESLPDFDEMDEAVIKHALANLLTAATNDDPEPRGQLSGFIDRVDDLRKADPDIDTKIKLLDAAAEKVVAEGRINEPLAIHQIASVRTYSRDAYGIAKQTLELALGTEWFQWPATSKAFLAPLRSVVTYHESEPLRVARTPLDILDGMVFEVVQGQLKLVDDKLIDLEGLIFDLAPGRTLIIEGEDAVAPGSLRTERVTIASVIHDLVDFSTRVGITAKLEHTYRRDRTILYGNVASATQGETRIEVLGSGDASKPSQRFTLRHQPLTHVPAANADGAASTLTVRVQGFAWPEVEHRAGLGTRDRNITTQADEQGRTIVMGGDGWRGARFPTGVENITAEYRSGQGSDGNIDPHKATNLATRPFGVQKVTNPRPASGGTDPDDIESTRLRAPLAVAALDRLLSVDDYRSFALRFAGIAKANAWRVGPMDLGENEKNVYLRWRIRTVIAGVDPLPLDPASALLLSLRLAMHALGDPSLELVLVPAKLERLRINAKIAVAPGYVYRDVEPLVRAELIARLGYAGQDIGRAIHPSRIVAIMQAVTGVDFVDLDQVWITSTAIDEEPLIFDPGEAILPDSETILFVDPTHPETLVFEELTR